MLSQDGQVQPLTVSGSNGWSQVSKDGRSIAFWAYDPENPADPELYLFERPS